MSTPSPPRPSRAPHAAPPPLALLATLSLLGALSLCSACGSGGGAGTGEADGVAADGVAADGVVADAGGADGGGGDDAGQDAGGQDAAVQDVGPMPEVTINEVCAKGAPIGTWNPTGSDWIELYNGGGVEIDLSGYRLIDSAKQPFSAAFALPKGTKIAAKGFLVVYFNHDGAGTPNIDKGLSGDEAMTFFHSGGDIIDVVNWEVGDAPVGKTWGRDPDGSAVFKTFDVPTPGKPNGG